MGKCSLCGLHLSRPQGIKWSRITVYLDCTRLRGITFVEQWSLALQEYVTRSTETSQSRWCPVTQCHNLALIKLLNAFACKSVWKWSAVVLKCFVFKEAHSTPRILLTCSFPLSTETHNSIAEEKVLEFRNRNSIGHVMVFDVCTDRFFVRAIRHCQ